MYKGIMTIWFRLLAKAAIMRKSANPLLFSAEFAPILLHYKLGHKLLLPWFTSGFK